MTSGTERWAGLLAVTLALVLSGCQIAAAPQPGGPQDPAAGSPTVSGRDEADETASPEQGQARSVTLAFAGDIHFEGGVAALLDDPDATVGPMASALRSADVAVVNLESALTSGGTRAEKELENPDRRFWFRSPPSALALLERSGVDAISMANNHGADYGAAGLRDTLRAADSSNVAVLGVGRDPQQAYAPYLSTVDGTRIAVLAADASPLESNAPIWDVGPDEPGLATARDARRLVAAVRRANASNDLVAVYLHWGAEGKRCPTAYQRELAQSLADAGADVVVGSHAHVLLGAGLLGDTYVSYGLGNFVWYHGRQPETGVLRLELADGKVVRDDWVPGELPPAGGQPRALTGAAGQDAVRDWRGLRGCTDLAPGPSAVPKSADERLPAYASSVEPLPSAVQAQMTGSSHDPARCPVGLADLRLLTVRHVGFDGRARTGRLVVHRRHAEDVVGVFRELYDARFPLRRLELVDAYGGDDDRSMAANNSSAYNCRTVAGESALSAHAYGAAIDLNPVENPYVTVDGVLPPAGQRFVEVDRSRGAKAGRGVVVADDVVVRAFTRIGWKWGGVWNEPDYQHFYAP